MDRRDVFKAALAGLLAPVVAALPAAMAAAERRTVEIQIIPTAAALSDPVRDLRHVREFLAVLRDNMAERMAAMNARLPGAFNGAAIETLRTLAL